MHSNRPATQQTADDCAKCGACTAVCPVYQVTGRESQTARGRLHLLGRLTRPSSAAYSAIISSCLLCGACRDACPRGIDTLAAVIHARQQLPPLAHHQFLEKLLARKTFASPRLLKSLSSLRNSLLKNLPKASGLWLKLAFLPEDYAQQMIPPDFSTAENKPGPQAISFFSGCLARYLSPVIGTATAFLTREATGSSLLVPEEQTCCGLASFGSGNREEARKLARKNIAAFAGHNLPILTSCASCYSHLRSYPELLADDPAWADRAKHFAARLQEFSQFFAGSGLFSPPAQTAGSAQDLPRVFYHDPCHLRFGPEKITAAPRTLIRDLYGSLPVELARGPHCCGQGGLFRLAHPDLADQIFSSALTELMELSVAHVVTTCSGCLLQWQQGIGKGGHDCQCSHLAVFLARIIRQGRESPAAMSRDNRGNSAIPQTR
ncbi:MAG: (Fe-S)-binding protein [Deltaproteobacteria bacterium]|nr:(Fe-S)-binding protein [Deltaproteobacteria bacterium]